MNVFSTLWLMPHDPAYADKAEQEASKEAMIFNCMQRKDLNFSCVMLASHL
jgi:hypothetical protein